MTKQRITIASVFILAILGLFVWGFPAIKDRYLSPENGSETKKEGSVTKNEPTQDATTTNNPNENSQSSENGNNQESSVAPSEMPFVKIKREDCVDNCKRFSKSQELAYCQNFCGLAKKQNDSGDCSNKSGLEKDYCFKNTAENNLDFSICEKISDKGIRESCITKITEILLDNQMKNSSNLPG